MFFGLVALIILISASALIYVNVKKNEIIKSILSEVNTLLIGEINVGKIEVESLWTYPNIIVRFNDVEIYEEGFPVREPSAEPVIYAPNVLARANLTEIFTSKLVIDLV